MRKNEENCRQILLCIATYVGLHGFAPTFLELCRMCGLKSAAAVRKSLKQLDEENWITYDASKTDSIEVRTNRMRLSGRRYAMANCG